MKITATCACCGRKESYMLSDEERKTFELYQTAGRSMGMIQNLFPNVPAWIRAGAIDKTTGGFCFCPKCARGE